VSGTLSWTAGESGPKTFTVPILEDTTPESLETIVVTLSNPAGASLGAPSSATVEIRDNDSSGGQTGGGAAAGGGGGGSIGVLWLLMLLGVALERRSAMAAMTSAQSASSCRNSLLRRIEAT
jgi:hypothetical protein